MIPIFDKPSGFASFIYRNARSIHTLKIALALLIVALFNWLWPVPHFIWAMVTIVIIMMGLPQVGGAIEKSLQRAIGTLIGSAYGVFLVIAMDSYWSLMGLLILGVCVVVLLNAGRYSYAYLVTGFTMIIVIGDANHDTSEALWRSANILIGCLIAVLVSLFVLPIKAKQDWRAQLGKSFSLMAEVLANHLQTNANVELPAERTKLENAMKAVLAQKKLFFSLEWESQTLKKHPQILAELANEQVRVITLLELLLMTHWQEEENAAYSRIKQVAQHLQQDFAALADYVNSKRHQRPQLPPELEQQLQQQLLSEQQLLAADKQQTAYQHFAQNGYGWLIYQLALALLAINQELDKLEQAYDRQQLLNKAMVE
ncbi:FUSC family protein [Shewanella dokdonensis]|uniref:FUSC family protein n=1 Tax=Shewanella dokdonensis TaxID=712036 RepID=A0ABX8DGE9_9GAMM|nr:FUSC family protein [Shewanella dokdonensis]MCL1074034.1 FUSC family protein [Shewanella dokdonensis]QVK23784.1 FUSC family protein [Shewanella dokdonensis]